MIRFIPLFLSICFLLHGDPLIFYHIPKCGGTSIASALAEHFAEDEIYWQKLKNPKKVATPVRTYVGKPLNIEAIDWDRIRYVHGHIGYRDHLAPDTARHITFLRNPTERICSAYRYAKKTRPVVFSQLYEKISNAQVRQLSGLPIKDPDISLQQYLDAAKKNLLERFFFVGITDEMEESLRVLYTLLGWAPKTHTHKFNTTKSEDISEEMLLFIQENEWADWELFEFAKVLFSSFQAKAAVLSTPIVTPPYVQELHWSVKDPLDGEGWGYREIDLGTQTRLRQSYLHDAFLRFPLEPVSYRIVCKISFPPIKKPFHFTISVNESPIEHKEFSQGKWKFFEGTIPSSLLTADLTKITFHISDLYVPGHHEANLDFRSLGVGLSEVHLTPLY